MLFVWAFQSSARRLQITHMRRLQHVLPAAACPFADVVVGLQQRTKLLVRGVLSEALARKLLCFDCRTAVARPLPLATSILSRRHVLYRPAGSPICTLTLRGHGSGRVIQRGDTAEVVAVAFHPTLPLLLTGSRDSSAKLWLLNADGTKLKRQVTLRHGSMIAVVSFHPRLPLLLTGGSDRCAKLWRVDLDCAAAAPLATLTGHNHYVISAAFHLRLPLLATSSSDGTAKLWHMSPEGSISPGCALTLKINSHSSMNRVAFHPFFPVLTTGHEMWLLNPEGNAVIATTVLLPPKECVAAVAFHPVLPLLATSGDDSSVKLWLLSADGASATCTATLQGHDFNVVSLAFHACLPLLATGSRDSSVKLWAVTAGGSAACTATLRGHDLSVEGVAFHPRLPLLVSGSWDGTAKLWR
jgi:WD40 repeat protein